MNARIVKWGVHKWKLHQRHFEQEIADAFELLNLECQKPSAALAGRRIRHVRNVLGGCPKDAGLRIDQQVLPLWAKLPDEAIKGLHLIIRAMLDGKCPLQALLVLIGFLSKEGGGKKANWLNCHALSICHAPVQRHYLVHGMTIFMAIGIKLLKTRHVFGLLSLGL